MPVTKKFVNHCERDDLKYNFQFDLKLDDYKDVAKSSEKSTDDYLMSSERSYLSYISPAFSPTMSRALINARELLKYSEKQISDICNKANDIDVLQPLGSETISTGNETLQHIQNVITKKFEDIDYGKKFASNPKEQRDGISLYSKETTDNKFGIKKCNNITERPHKHNMRNKKQQTNYCSSLCTNYVIPMMRKKIYTARSVQTDSLEVKSSSKNNSKLQKLKVQTAPVLSIPPSIKKQTLDCIHISPECSISSNIKNTKSYHFKHNDSNEGDTPQFDIKSKKEMKNNLLESMREIHKAVTTYDNAKGTIIPEKYVSSELMNKEIEKLSKVPNKSTKSFSCQTNSEFQCAKRKLNFNDSTLRNISLKTVHFSDIDDILNTNNQKLDNVLQKTTKMCKALYHQLVHSSFKSLDKNSSDDRMSNVNSGDAISTNIESFSEKSDDKNKTSTYDNDRNVTRSFSFNNSDLQIFKETSENHTEVIWPQTKNSYRDCREKESLDNCSVKTANSDNEKLKVDNNCTFKSPANENNWTSQRSYFATSDDISLIVETKVDYKEPIAVNNNLNAELYPAHDRCNSNCSTSKKREKTDEVCEQTKSDSNSTLVKDDIQHLNVGQLKTDFLQTNFKNGYENDRKEMDVNNIGNVNNEDRFSGTIDNGIGIIANNSGENGDNLDYVNNGDKDVVVQLRRNVIDRNNCVFNNKEIPREDLQVNKKEILNIETLLESKKLVAANEIRNKLNDEERHQKHAQKHLEMNELLTKQISYRINEEMKEIMEKTEKNLRLFKSEPTECSMEEKRYIKTSSVPGISKYGISESDQSEGELRSSSECTHSLGEVKLYSTSYSLNSQESWKIINSN